MDEGTYFISEVSRMVGVEPHVLRYWEEEMDLHISRNSQGKRCYTAQDVEWLRRVKFWKDKGMQLKAVKELLDPKQGGDGGTENLSVENARTDQAGSAYARAENIGMGKAGLEDIGTENIGTENEEDPAEYSIVTVEEPSDSRQKFERILDEIVGRALERNNDKLLEQISDAVSRELEDRLEMKLEELLQRELLQEMLRAGEREAAAAESRPKKRFWERWRKGYR